MSGSKSRGRRPVRVLVQWARSSPSDWVELNVRNSRDVRDLPRKPVPTASSVVDNSPGWLCAVNVQGIVFSGYDHLAIEPVGQALRVTGWCDDPEDHGDTRWGTSWLLEPPGPDPALNGAVNTRQTRTVWGTPEVAEWFPGVEVLPWAEFVPPPSNLTRHGIWLPDDLFIAHNKGRSHHGWREWIT